MNRSSLAEKQLPWSEIDDMESMSSLQEQPGPSGFLDQRSHLPGVSIMRAIQRLKPRVFISTRVLAWSQGSFRLQQSPKSIADFRDITEFAFTLRPTSEQGKTWVSWSIEPSEDEARFIEPAAAATSSPAETLQNRYKELSSKRYMDSLTSDERIEIKNIEATARRARHTRHRSTNVYRSARPRL